MPKMHEMLESRFLKKEDTGSGVLYTVTGCQQENISKEGAPEQMKWCLTFQETDKPLVLNSTNIQLCTKIFGSDDTDDWIGRKLVLYEDPNVSYQGKVVGGIRVRAPKTKTTTKPPARPAPPVVNEDVDDDDPVPF